MSPRRRTAATLVVVAVALGAWRWWRAVPAQLATAPAAAPHAAQGSVVPPPDAAPPDASAVRRARLVRRVVVEPAQPCRGADVTVRVELRPAAADAKVAIAGRPGSTAVLRFDDAGRHPVSVVARDWGDRMQIRRAWVPVADCTVDPARLVARPADGDRVGFQVTVPERFGPPLRYRWDFGDGATTHTVRPTAMHDYAARRRSGASSSFVARVIAVDAAGAGVEARAAVTLSNPEWLASRGGTRWLPTRAERFVPRVGDATAPRVATVHVRDDGSGTTLERVALRGFACADLERVLPAALPIDALSRAGLRPDRWTDVQVAIPAGLWSEPVCRAELRLLGRTAAGGPAVALTAVEFDVAAARRRVTDPALIARLQAAKRMLGRGRISEEDLRQLAARGE